MNFQLTPKERSLLVDQQGHEELCIQKYTSYAQAAQDPQLKAIFQNHAQIEQEHLNSVNQLLNGQIPVMNNSQNQQSAQGTGIQPAQPIAQGTGTQPFQQSGGTMTQGATQTTGAFQGGQAFSSQDQDLCRDMLVTEKYISGAYDTTIFEMKNTQARDVLNHIQKEEQKHGEAIYQYMEKMGMYQGVPSPS